MEVRMARVIVALFLLSGAVPLFAQYGPPARDLDDAQQILKEIERQLTPAVAEAREQAEVLNVIAKAHNQLEGALPATEITSAIKIIDDYLERLDRNEHELSRENRKTIDSVRKELELASNPPYAIPALRERLHHEFVHPLEREVLANLADLNQLEQTWNRFLMSQMARAREESMGAIATVAIDGMPKKGVR
jgi:hypothetical protein